MHKLEEKADKMPLCGYLLYFEFAKLKPNKKQQLLYF